MTWMRRKRAQNVQNQKKKKYCLARGHKLRPPRRFEPLSSKFVTTKGAQNDEAVNEIDPCVVNGHDINMDPFHQQSPAA